MKSHYTKTCPHFVMTKWFVISTLVVVTVTEVNLFNCNLIKGPRQAGATKIWLTKHVSVRGREVRMFPAHRTPAGSGKLISSTPRIVYITLLTRDLYKVVCGFDVINFTAINIYSLIVNRII